MTGAAMGTPNEDWADGQQKLRVLRGAAWSTATPMPMWSSHRYPNVSSQPVNEHGFRCVLEVSAR